MKNIRFTITAILATVALTSQAGLVAHWNLEEGSGTTTTEAVSSTVSAAMTGSWSTSTAAPGSTYSYGLIGTRFDSNLNATDVGINGSGAKTIMAWINTSSASEGAFFNYTPTGGVGAGQDIRLLVKNGGLRMEVSSGGFEFGSGLTDGGWHMVAFVMNASDGINDVDVYIDGTYTARSGGGTLINTAGTGSFIGFGNEQTGGRGYTGLLDDVAIYDGALTKSELDDIRVNGIPEPATLGLVGLFGGGILFIRRKLAI